MPEQRWYLDASPGLSEMAAAATVIDGPGGFIPSFTGTQTPDIDILSASLDLSGTNLIFSATLNGTIRKWCQHVCLGKWSRGGNCALAVVGQTGVVFDAVLTVTGAGVQGGRDTLTNAPISVPANTSRWRQQCYRRDTGLIIAGRGFTASDQYLWNFWTRGSAGRHRGGRQPGFADFAPDNSDAGVTPLPAALPLFVGGGGLLGFFELAQEAKERCCS